MAPFGGDWGRGGGSGKEDGGEGVERVLEQKRQKKKLHQVRPRRGQCLSGGGGL